MQLLIYVMLLQQEMLQELLLQQACPSKAYVLRCLDTFGPHLLAFALLGLAMSGSAACPPIRLLGHVKPVRTKVH